MLPEGTETTGRNHTARPSCAEENSCILHHFLCLSY